MLRFEKVLIRQGSFELRADMTVLKGRKVAVIGPSGAGKSTLLGAVGGFIPLSKGRLWWGEQDITNVPPGTRPLSMLFQDNNLFPHLSVMQNVSLGLRPDMKLTAQDRDRVDAAMDRVGLSAHASSKPAQMSGGQQSRAALARILVQDRPLVLLDEPFAALGPALRAEMLDLVADLIAETASTLLMVTHAPEDARRIADDIVFVSDGLAHAPAPAVATLDAPPPALRAYLG